MMTEKRRRARWVRPVQLAANAIAGMMLALAIVLVVAESTWASSAPSDAREAFLHASTGTELMPLPVFRVIFDLFPEHFQPAGPKAGSWMKQFGFIEDDEDGDGVPHGFTLSRHRPRSGAPSPTPFVGVSCSLCHTAKIKRSADDPGLKVLGMGTTSLDFIAWVDAFKSAVLDERLTMAAISTKYREKTGESLGVLDGLMTRLWLADTRRALRENMPKTDRPYDGVELRESTLMPNGPSRTQPFRNLVRNVMDLPAATDHAFCKIPTLYRQEDRTWGQFDGSVKSKLTRSVLAAIAVGATIHNLPMPDIASGVQGAIDYTLTLDGPRYSEVFAKEAAALDPAAIARGGSTYMQHCDSCHGHPEGSGWVKGARQDQIVPIDEIGTDPARLTFRFYGEMPQVLVDFFPAKHPLRPARAELRPGPAGKVRGYLNMPIHSAFAHAPYLHNGSVMTLAELINLKPRKEHFYRGEHVYDPLDAGLIAPATRDTRHYFAFDGSQPGNSVHGHEYPWKYRGPGWDEAALHDLLTYLKTL